MKKKNGEKGKKGCWWYGLVCILLLLLAGAMAILMAYLNGRNGVDSEFQRLVNQKFDSTAFSDNVSKLKPEFASKIRDATGSEAVCSEAGEVNFAVLNSSESRLVKDWALKWYDFAIYCSQRNANSVLSDDNLEIVMSYATINRLEWEITNQKIEYTIVYQFKGKDISNFVRIKTVPDYVFLVAKSTIDLSLLEPVKMYNYTINKLTGEDNEYCLKKIFGDTKYNESLQKKLAYLPFSYLEELKNTLKAKIVLSNDAITLKPQ